MKEQAFICPICKQTDLVEKVSMVYIMGLEMRRENRAILTESDGRNNPAHQLFNSDNSTFNFPLLSHRLAPPASSKEITRPLHPDLIVLVFSLIVPIFLYGILSTQPGMLLPVLLILAGCYGFYFWQRKSMVSKFKRQQFARQMAAHRVQRGIERWMKLYYCAREDGVFEPGTGVLIPVDEMMEYLLQE